MYVNDMAPMPSIIGSMNSIGVMFAEPPRGRTGGGWSTISARAGSGTEARGGRRNVGGTMLSPDAAQIVTGRPIV